MDQGEINRDRMLELFKIYKAETLADLREAMVLVALTTGEASGDDATEFLDNVIYTGDYRIIGAVFSQRHVWQLVRREPTRIARRNKREIKIWTLA